MAYDVECTLHLFGVTDNEMIDKICDQICASYGAEKKRSKKSLMGGDQKLTIQRVFYGEMENELREVLTTSGLGFTWRSEPKFFSPEAIVVSDYRDDEIHSYYTVDGDISLRLYELDDKDIAKARIASEIITRGEETGLYVTSSAHETVALAKDHPEMVEAYAKHQQEKHPT